jgi:dipeptidyl aminopeptidase/acylaminoacyl peptidase
MTSLPRLRACAALVLASSAFVAPPASAQAGAALPPIEKFFARPTLDQVRLSPKGKYLAALSGAPGRRDVLVVIDLASLSAKVVAGYKDFDVVEFEWVNEDRLLYGVGDNRVALGDTYQTAGLFAVNRDGSAGRQLASRHADPVIENTSAFRLKQNHLPWNTVMTGQRGAEDSDHVYVARYDFYPSSHEIEAINLLRLNTVTGQSNPVAGPFKVKRWLFDNAGEPRLAISAEGDTSIVHYRDPASGTWRRIASYLSYTGAQDAFNPVGFDGAGGLYVEANAGNDTSALYQFSLGTGKLSAEPLIVAKGYDFDGSFVSRRGKLLGAHLRTDAESGVWFDPAMHAIQQQVDAVLPGRINLLSVPSNAEPLWVLVKSYSDVHPISYILYHTQTGELTRVGEAYPGIDPARMGRQQAVRYKARDGREIPALLTLPAGAGKDKRPLVVLVHGGPFVRGRSWGWDAEAQFLASRGYAVLEPEFRGSLGFGQSHYRAGWKQWGMAMQDDLADGARWAVDQGYAAPDRICIAGASYGGYAALMGVIKDSDLYRCAVSLSGVTDIELLYGHWSFRDTVPDDWKKYGMPELVGDRVRDAAQLKATSPIAQAARLTRPVLLAHGTEDRRVPLVHAKRFREAVAGANKQVEWIEYPNEAHAWWLPENRIDFWGRVEKFLDKHIGQGAAK